LGIVLGSSAAAIILVALVVISILCHRNKKNAKPAKKLIVLQPTKTIEETNNGEKEAQNNENKAEDHKSGDDLEKGKPVSPRAVVIDNVH